ncbi:hypothetical protein C0J52_22231 [Blattella germanica]|nr:hypothetical protein C0J52_22231 [Blattella germanica]
MPHSTESLPAAPIEHANAHHPASFPTHAQTHKFESQSTKPPQSQTEGPFKPNTSPYGDGKFVGIVYKDGNRDNPERPRFNPDLDTKLPSTPVPNYNNQQKNLHNTESYLSPPAHTPTRHQPNHPQESFSEPPTRNVQRPKSQPPVLHTTQNIRSPITVEPNGNSGHQPYAVQNREVLPSSEQTSFPYEEYESVKLPVQPNSGKHRFAKPNDYRDFYADYDDKAYYDDVLPLEEDQFKLEKPQPSREPEKSANEQNYNSGNVQIETKFKDSRGQSSSKDVSTTENIPQTSTRTRHRGESLEQNYEGTHESQRLPSREKGRKPEPNDDKKTSNINDYSSTSIRPDTTTEDRFPPPPPEFFDDFNKYKHIENPFASLDFDFDDYLDKLRGKPSSTPNPTQVSTVNSQIENENIRSTTYQNVIPPKDEVTTTTTRKPRIRLRTRPRKRPSQEKTTENVKEYIPTERPKILYNSNPTVRTNGQSESLRNKHKEISTSSNFESLGNILKKDPEASTTTTSSTTTRTTTIYTPQTGVATAIRPVNPNPLTVPFYTGEDGNFYINPDYVRPDTRGPQLQSNNANSQVDDYYKYAIDDVVQSTERTPRIISTSELYPHNNRDTFSNSKDGVFKQKPYDYTSTTPNPTSITGVSTHHPIVDAVTNPTRGSNPRRGSTRIKPVDNSRIPQSSDYNIHAGQTQQNYETPSLPVQPHPFSVTTSSVNDYKYQDVPEPSTEFTPPKPVVTQSTIETKPKKTFQSNYQVTLEENDTIKPLKDFRNERIPENHKIITSSTTSAAPSTVTTEVITTSSTQYSNWDTRNNWQSTTPYYKDGNVFGPSNPTQPKIVHTKFANHGNKFSQNVELTPPTIEYTTGNIPHVNSFSTTPNTLSDVRTTTRPTNELLESVYDIAKSMFNPQYEGVIPSQLSETVYIAPSSESAIIDTVTEAILQNFTSTAPHTVRPKLRRRRPIQKTSTPLSAIHHITEYPTTGFDLSDHTTPETYTIRRRPSNKDQSTRQRLRRPNPIPFTSTTANAIVTTSLPSNDIDTTFSTTVKAPLSTRTKPPLMGRRHRRPTKTKGDTTTTEAYDNDKSESFDRPLQDSTNRLNKKPLPQQESSTTPTDFRYSMK